MARLLLIDSFNFIFRAFHARQRTSAAPMRTSRGTSTEAIYIFHNMVRRLQKQYRPEYLAAVYESEGPTFRDEQFAEYKANRAETPPELIEQIPAIARMLEAMKNDNLSDPAKIRFDKTRRPFRAAPVWQPAPESRLESKRRRTAAD